MNVNYALYGVILQRYSNGGGGQHRHSEDEETLSNGVADLGLGASPPQQTILSSSLEAEQRLVVHTEDAIIRRLHSLPSLA